MGLFNVVQPLPQAFFSEWGMGRSCCWCWGHIGILFLTFAACGCDGSQSVDAGATRAFWTDFTHLVVPLKEAETSDIFAAAERIDRLNPKQVDPKVVDFTREVSAFYRRMGNFRRDAFERGQKGLGIKMDEGEIKSLSDESNRVAKKLMEIDQYVRDTYHY
jgi:hypothetical protein